MRTHHNLHHTYIVCLFISEEKQTPLFAPTDVYKTSCNIQLLSIQMAIGNLSYYLPFKMASAGYQTQCHVRLPVCDFSNSLPYSPVSRQDDSSTAGHYSVLPSAVLFQQTAVQ
jgi:hypothetical protein